MKLGDTEVPDGLLEEALKKLGKRLVEENDYIRKSEAASDLAKFRAVTGETRSIEDIADIIKRHEETENKNKTQTELLKAEVDRMKAEMAKREKAIQEYQFKERKDAVAKHFDVVASKIGVKVIPSILEKYRETFYKLDEKGLPQEEFDAKVTEALKNAQAEQARELQALGIGSGQPDAGFGAGIFNPNPESRTVAHESDIAKLLSDTASSGRLSPFSMPKPTQG